jgi:regulation of enolase protein 1 (concanavalin A-like superfamily)
LKSARRVTIDGDVMEHNWSGFQDGTAILLTPRNQEDTAPWTVVRDITISNNIVRDVGNAITILGEDYNNPSLQTQNIRILNNVFSRVGYDFGAGKFLIITSGPANITVNHNTVDHDGSVVVTSGPATPGFVFTNNFLRHNTYGIYGQNKAAGLSTLNYYFPGHVVTGNVLAGGKASSYPAGNYFPSATGFLSSFVDAAQDDYRLVASSPYNNTATDGKDIGADMGALDAALADGTPGTSDGGTSDPAPEPTPEPEPEPDPAPEPPADSLPSGWDAQDVGAVGIAGSTAHSGGVFTVKGAGSDIWSAADEFHFASRTLDGDGTIVARVKSIAGVDGWTKAGVMIRASTQSGSVHGFMLVSIGKGLAFQRRRATNGTSTHTSGGSGTAPRWVKLTRAGNVVSAYRSTDGSTWSLVGTDTLSLPADVRIGLAVTGRDRLATAVFDNVTVTSGAELPSGWSSTDVGSVGLKGSAVHSAGTFTVKGAGANIWGTADGFHFAARTLSGDGEIVARVSSAKGGDQYAKFGVMVRQTLDAGSAHALLAVTGNGLAFASRTVTGGTSTRPWAGSGSAPRWLRLARTGQEVTASTSTDGTSWTVVGRTTLSIAGDVSVGLVVSSHSTSTLATGTFDTVTVR